MTIIARVDKAELSGIEPLDCPLKDQFTSAMDSISGLTMDQAPADARSSSGDINQSREQLFTPHAHLGTSSPLQPLVPESQLTTTGFPRVEEQRLHALMVDVDFREGASRGDQIMTACKHLKSVEDRERICFQAIECFFGVNGAIISSHTRLVEQPFRLIARRSLLSEEKKN
jgi:hypothetical protein